MPTRRKGSLPEQPVSTRGRGSTGGWPTGCQTREWRQSSGVTTVSISAAAMLLLGTVCGCASPRPRPSSVTPTGALLLHLARIEERGRPAKMLMSVVNCGSAPESFLRPIEVATRGYTWRDPAGEVMYGVICGGVTGPSRIWVHLAPGDRWEVPCDTAADALEISGEWSASAQVDLNTSRGKVRLAATLAGGESESGDCRPPPVKGD